MTYTFVVDRKMASELGYVPGARVAVFTTETDGTKKNPNQKKITKRLGRIENLYEYGYLVEFDKQKKGNREYVSREFYQYYTMRNTSPRMRIKLI